MGPPPRDTDAVAQPDHSLGEQQFKPIATAQRLAVEFAIADRLIDELLQVHRALWKLEDDARSAADDHRRARCKVSIDETNRRRHQVIGEIDAMMNAESQSRGGIAYQQTVGEFIDTLIILQVKLDALYDLNSRPALDAELAAECRRMLSACGRRAAHANLVADQLISHVHAGLAQLLKFSEPKVYDIPEFRRFDSVI